MCTRADRPLLPRLLGWAASLALLAITVVVLRGRWEEVAGAGGLPGVAPSLGAGIAFLAANLVLVAAWRELVGIGAPRPDGRLALWVWSVSQLARYAFTLGQVAGRGVAARRYGMSATTGVISTLLELTFTVATTAALTLATLPWWLPAVSDLRWLAWMAVVPAAGLVAVLAAPTRIVALLDRALHLPGLRVVGRRVGGFRGRVVLDRSAVAIVTDLYLLNLAVRLLGFLLLFAAVGGEVGEDGLVAIGAFAVGHLAGSLAVFAPGGLGAREGATALVVAPVIGGGAALVLVAAVRLLEIVAELVLLAIARTGLRHADDRRAPG